MSALLLLLAAASTIAVVIAACPPPFVAHEGDTFCHHIDGLGPLPWVTSTPILLADGQWHSMGAAFRVWAPHANSVKVNGVFASQPIAMTSEGNGYWYTNVGSAKDGDWYVYQITYEGRQYTRLDPAARMADGPQSKRNASVVHSVTFDWGLAETSYAPPPKSKMVIYELHLPTFNPSGMEGNSTAVNGGVGTFDDAIKRLDYIALLGANVVEILPISEFPGDSRGWGYNPGYYYLIMQNFGGYEGLRTFVREAHARGLAVFIDVVWNHMGDPNMYYQYDGWSERQSGLPSGDTPQGIYFYQNDQADTEWGLRPNYRAQEVKDYLIGSLQMMVQECHVDGFRHDSVICIRKGHRECWNEKDGNPDGIAILQQMNAASAKWGGIFNIAEDLQGDEWVTRALGAGGLGFDGQWDDGSYYGLNEILTSRDDGSRDLNKLRGIVAPGGTAPSWRVLYTENHDKVSGQGSHQGRWPNIVDRSNPTGYLPQKLSILAAAVVITAPGIPMLFSGQEFLSHQDFVFGNVPDQDWSQVGRYTKSGGWQNIGPFKGIFDLYSTFIALRTNQQGTTSGLTSLDVNIYYSEPSNKVVVFQRGNVVVVMNLGGTPFAQYGIGITAAGTWQVRLNSDLKKWSSIFGDVGAGVSSVQATSPGIWAQPAQALVPLGAYSVLILSQ